MVFKSIFKKIFLFFETNNLASKNKRFYCYLNRIINGCEIGYNVYFPSSSRIIHGNGVVIGQGSKTGENVKIYQNVTLGEKDGKYPEIGEGVTIYPNSILLGGIKIGKNSIIGAGTILDKDVPENKKVYNKRDLVIR